MVDLDQFEAIARLAGEPDPVGENARRSLADIATIAATELRAARSLIATEAKYVTALRQRIYCRSDGSRPSLDELDRLSSIAQAERFEEDFPQTF